jgi:hypothetical protein
MRSFDLSNKKFLEMDKHNFMYDTHSVYEIKLNNKKSLHTYGQNNGILEIHMRDGKKKKFLIPTEQDIDQVKEMIS